MSRVLLITQTTGYQKRAFSEAASRLGVELVYVTDRCNVLGDIWEDGSLAVHFHEPGAATAVISASLRGQAIDGVMALGDRCTELAALVAQEIGLPGHHPDAAHASRSKRLTRERLRDAGLPTPWFISVPRDAQPEEIVPEVTFPCVLKPGALSGSRGVIRANTPREFDTAFRTLQQILGQADVQVLRDPENDLILIEGFIPGREYAIEGVLERGTLHVLAIFDKPDPLDGPYFEETIYVTPSRESEEDQDHLTQAVSAAARALGLWHGPIHAECRSDGSRVVMLEVAARPIGGLCARALQFVDSVGGTVSFEELLLRFAVGEALAHYQREAQASAVMMMPITGLGDQGSGIGKPLLLSGYFNSIDGLDEARAEPGIVDIIITAKPGQRLVPAPYGSSYPGFIFSKAESSAAAVAAIRRAHERLMIRVDAALPLAPSR